MLRELTTMKHMMKWACVLMLVAALPVSAKSFNFDLAKLKLDAPDEWTCEMDDGKILHMTEPGEGLTIKAYSVDEPDLDAALKDGNKEVDAVLTDAAIEGEPSHTDNHGLKAVEVHGKGKSDGKDMSFHVVIVMSEHPVIFIGYGTPEAEAAHITEIQAIFASIQPEG